MNFPDDARYHVHVFEARVAGPIEVYRRFQPTLTIAFTGWMRKRRPGWWDFNAGGWWAKAHDRNFDCEVSWPAFMEAVRSA